MKTARFGTVVAKCGKPTPHLAWLAPEKDRELQAAQRADRVMTLHQIARGGHKDFGVVGLEKGPQTQLLIFPRSLRRFQDRRIVAIDYRLLAGAVEFQPAKDTPLKGAQVKGTAARPAKVVAFPRAKPAPARPAEMPLPKPVKMPPLVEAQPLVTWSDALAEVQKIKRRLMSREVDDAKSALSALALRIGERLKPH